MFIYVIKKNDSLLSIATKYYVTIESIRIYNGLTTSNLVTGQDLLIPTNIYIVQPVFAIFYFTNEFHFSENFMSHKWFVFKYVNDRDEIVFTSKT